MKRQGIKELERQLRNSRENVEKSKKFQKRLVEAIAERKADLAKRGTLVDLALVARLAKALDEFRSPDNDAYGFTIIGLDDEPLMVLCGLGAPESFDDAVYKHLVSRGIPLEELDLQGDCGYNKDSYIEVVEKEVQGGHRDWW